MPKMERDKRRAILEAHGLSPDLLAVDPHGCGCTECIIGEYIPEHEIPRDQVALYQSLIEQGVLSDHTSGWFMPSEPETFTREDMARAWSEGREAGLRDYDDRMPDHSPNPYED